MSNDRITPQEQSQQLLSQLLHAEKVLRKAGPDASVSPLCDALSESAAFLRRFTEGRGKLSRKLLVQQQNTLLNQLKPYRVYYLSLPKQDQRRLAGIYQQVFRGVLAFGDPQSPGIRAFTEMLEATAQLRRSYALTQGRELLLPAGQNHSVTGQAPGVQDLMEIHIPGTDPEKAFQALLWLGQKAVLAQTTGLPDNNLYHQYYQQLMGELNRAPLEEQLIYVQLFNRQEIRNLALLSAAPAPQDPRVYLYIGAFREMCAQIQGPLGSLLFQTRESQPGDIPPVPGQPSPTIAELQEATAKRLNEAQKEAHTDALREELLRTYLQDDIAPQIHGLLEEALNPKGRTSPTYRAMARMLADFGRENHAEIPDPQRYRKRLIACDRAARQYMHLHRKESDRPRYHLAQKITDLCSRIGTAQLEKEKADILAEHGRRDQAHPQGTEELIRLARLQKSAVTGSIQPRIRDEDPPLSGWKRFTRSLGHGMFSLLGGLAAVTVGLPGTIAGLVKGIYVYGFRSPSQAIRRGEIRRSVPDLVPGERDPRLQEKLSTATDPVTGVLADTRRIPLVWEQPIPEDPNLPPVVSFRVRQPRSGSPIAEVVDKKGDTDSGHSHICIRYSRRDPVTGRLQRYESSFGFYGKGGFWDDRSIDAMTQIGYRIPGELQKDGGLYSVEKNVEVTYPQLNQLILFAQNYEKEGYNSFHRNCTTFLADSAKILGLDMNEVMKETDFTSESSFTNYGPLILPLRGNLLLAANAEEAALKKTGRDDSSYQRLGQKMVGAEHFERKTHRTFNQRMAGYSPGAVGQAIRADTQYSLRNFDENFHRTGARLIHEEVESLFYNRDEEKIKEADRFGLKFFSSVRTTELRNPIPAALLGLRRLVSDTLVSLQNKTDNPVGTDALMRQVSEYTDTMTLAMADCARAAMGASENARLDETAAARGSQLANEYIDALDHFFGMNFRSDAELREPFREIAAMAQEVKLQFDRRYRTCKEKNDGDMILKGNKAEDTRDMALVAKEFLSKEEIWISGRIPPREIASVRSSLPQIMGVLRVYDDMGQYIRDRKFCSTLAKQDVRSDAEEKQLKKLRMKLDTVNAIGTSLRTMPLRNRMDDSGLNMLFNTLPARSLYTEANQPEEGILKLQCLAYEHVFQGVMRRFGPELEKDARDIRDALVTKNENVMAARDAYRKAEFAIGKMSKESPDYPAQKAELDQLFECYEQKHRTMELFKGNRSDKYMKDASEKIGTALVERLQTLNPEDKVYLRKIQTCIAQRMYAQDRENDPEAEPTGRDYAALAAAEILDTVAGTYGPLVVEGIMVRLSINRPYMLPNSCASLDVKAIRSRLTVPSFLKAPIQGLTDRNNPDLTAPLQGPAERDDPNPTVPAGIPQIPDPCH